MSIKPLTDWRTHYWKRPTLLLGLALGSGLLLGATATRRRSSRDDRPPGQMPRRAAVERHVGDAWRSLHMVLLGIASAKVMDFVNTVVPRFKGHLDSASPRRVHVTHARNHHQEDADRIAE
jgi:hypothetical protein